MILQQKLLNFDMHCKHYTGEYVLEHNDKHIKNNMESRALDCIYLRPSSISKNVHKFCHISTKKVITRQFCKRIPTPANIINIIEQQAQDNNMPIGITFKPIDKSYPHLRIAGVESDINNKLQNEEQNNNQPNHANMDTNEIHDILQEPSDFDTPNTNHNAYVPNNNNINEIQNQNIQSSLII